MASTFKFGNLQHQLGGCLIVPLGSGDNFWTSKKKQVTFPAKKKKKGKKKLSSSPGNELNIQTNYHSSPKVFNR